MVRVFLVLGQDPPKHRALNQLAWQRLKGGWLGADGPCPWDISESRDSILIYNQAPSNSTMLYTRGPNTSFVTNYPPFLRVVGRDIPNRRFLDRWIEGTEVLARGIQQDFFKDVFRVPFGHTLRLSDRGARVVECVHYPQEQWVFEDALTRLKVLLYRSVLDGVERDSKHALALSSGLDSTLLGAILRDCAPKLHAFTMESRVPGADERHFTQESANLLGLPLLGFDIDQCPVLETSATMDRFWGPQAHPGEGHETEFFQFVADRGFKTIWTGVAADQLFHVDPSVVIRETITRPGWSASELLNPGRGWRGMLNRENPRIPFNSVAWDLAVRHQMRVQERTGVTLIQPFMEPDFVNFVLGLPNLFLASPSCDKLILREVGSRLIPQFNNFRRKHTDFGPSVQFRLNYERATRSKTFSPKEWRRTAAERWLGLFYGKR
ncbi:asparagine synthase-related protein [Microvenator marinus]|nr:asparagine synthase C-terminal domain-containing protein [Microvenator marinus]